MTVKITFLGHSGFLIASGDHTVAIDPWLTGNPRAAMTADQLECDLIVVTHGHEDHFSDVPAIAKRTGATVVAAYEICNFLKSDEGGSIANLEPANPGGKVITDFGSVAMTQAFHSSSFNGQYMGQPCGAVVAIGGRKIYHLGDTALFGDLKLLGEIFVPDVAIVPVGDRFTMGPEMATQAAELIGAPVAIPCHYGTFDLLASDITNFKPVGVKVRPLEPGESIEL